MKKYSSKKSAYEDAFTLQSLYSKNEQLQKLADIVCSHLPIEFQAKISVLKFQDRQMLLSTYDQLLAYKLRFLLTQLKTNLQHEAEFKNLSTIKLKIISSISPNSSSAQEKQPVELVYSEKSAQLLAEFSDSLGSNNEDLALQQALKKLARHILAPQLNEKK